MKNSEYWKKRFELLEQSQNQQGLQCYADIEKQYRQAQKQIEGQIAAWYQRFAKNNGITLADARKMLTSKELEELKWDINQYIQYGEENAINGTWVKQLENASARYHISRLEALKLQTQQSIEAMFGNQLDSIDSAMRNIYTSGYYRTAFEIQKGVGVGWDFATLDEKQISKIINKPWAVDGKNFSERIWGNRQKLVNELNTELTRTVSQEGFYIKAKSTDEGAVEVVANDATPTAKQVKLEDVTPVADSYTTPAVGDYVVFVDAFTEYTTYVMGNGAFSYEDIGAKVPYAMARDEKTDGGVDLLYTRQRKVFAPFGISYEKKSQATLSPTDAELKNGENWSLVHSGESVAANRSYINHKAIPIARIISRG